MKWFIGFLVGLFALFVILILLPSGEPEPDISELIEITDLSLNLGINTATARGRIVNHSLHDLRAVMVDLEFTDSTGSLVNASRVAAWDLAAGSSAAFERVVERGQISSFTTRAVKVTK